MFKQSVFLLQKKYSEYTGAGEKENKTLTGRVNNNVILIKI